MEILYKKFGAEISPEVLGHFTGDKLIFESATTKQMKGRYSFVALETAGILELTDDALLRDGEVINDDKPYQALEQEIAKMKIDDCEIPEELNELPFISGLMGYCSFDLIRHRNKILKSYPVTGKYPDAAFYMIESVYVFDHFKEVLYVITSNLFSNDNAAQLKSRHLQMIDRLKNIELFTASIESKQSGPITVNISDHDFMEEVSYYKELIQKGDMFQVVPSRIYSYPHYFDPHKSAQLKLQLYKNLKRQNPSPYMYYLDFKDFTVVGASPESFIKKTGRTITTNPIAGTIRRGKNHAEDEQLSQHLLNDEKELAEHRMLVDLGRNDLNQIAVPGSVNMPKLMTIEKFEHVQHIVTVVEGILDTEHTPLDIITSMLPAGTVSGAPKTRAISRIYERRHTKRGLYAGGIGYINCNHDLDFALTIRTMLIDDEHINVEAGCGVVYDSIPEKELNETLIKAKSLLEVTP